MLIDFHAHILPGVDHGSDSLEVSLRQLALAKKAGVSRIVATSHFYPHSRIAATFVERRECAYRGLLAASANMGIDILLGAETLICNAIEELPYIDELCVRGTKILLLELPFADFQLAYCESVYNLVSRGYTVVMAHAERYDKSWISETLAAGARLQVNAKAFSLFNRRKISPWLESGDIVAIGSDIHGADTGAYKVFSKAAKKAEKIAPQVRSFSDMLLEGVAKKNN